MENQLKSIEKILDKTIDAFKLQEGELWLKFTDNTFIKIIVKFLDQGFDYELSVIGVEDTTIEKTDYSLVELDLLSEEDYKKAREEERYFQQKVYEESLKGETEYLIKAELELLEKLKLKYENNSK